ncbi:MAG: carotenoid oxygenase family protein [Acidobacteriota bacterium]
MKGLEHPGLTRRDFGRLVATMGALGCIEPHTVARALGNSPKRLSWMAYRTAGAEGTWELTDVEGTVPKDLDGTLFRVAPGQSENHGVVLQHLFDGDAFLSGFGFRDGKVSLTARFLETPQRREELDAGRMLYSEFGTAPPPSPDGVKPGLRGKNQPSVNVVPWDGRLLGLSEGGHPTAIDRDTFAYQGPWDFHGTLPSYIPFTAHPKVDPATGEAYGFGVMQGPALTLHVFRMEPDGKLTELHAVPQGGYFMIHDMLLSENHFAFIIPPVRFELAELFSGKGSPADALQYFESEPTKILVLRRDGTGDPIVVEQPANMVFHNGNAWEKDGKLYLDTILSPHGDVLELLHSFAKEKLVLPEADQQLTRLEIDLAQGKLLSRNVFAEDQEFPRYDIRDTGRDARYLYTMGSGIEEDPLASTFLARHDLHAGTTARVDAEPGRALGETVFVPRSQRADDGWLLLQGYDARRDENYLEIRDAETLDFASRAWTGQHFPLGFHGNFVSGVHVGNP